jgi:hypothetical protein
MEDCLLLESHLYRPKTKIVETTVPAAAKKYLFPRFEPVKKFPKEVGGSGTGAYGYKSGLGKEGERPPDGEANLVDVFIF